jgi:hypothetical protein
VEKGSLSHGVEAAPQRILGAPRGQDTAQDRMFRTSRQGGRNSAHEQGLRG